MPVLVTEVSSGGTPDPGGSGVGDALYVIPCDGVTTVDYVAASGALDETAITWQKGLSAIYALDSSAGAGARQVPCLMESTANKNLRVARYAGANLAPAGDVVTRSEFVATGDNVNQFLSATAANLAATTGVNSQLTTKPGQWSVKDQQTAGAASASKSAGAGAVRRVCTSVSMSIATGVTPQLPVVVNLRDGASGAGTIIRTWALAAVAGTTASICESDLNIVGTAATAMTLEFAAATSAAVVGSVNLAGYDSQ